MLPFLPALILLLLQGPTTMDRACSRQLPGALDALHRQIASAPDKQQLANEVVLASLLSSSSDKDLSRALFQLLTLIDSPEIEARQPALPVERSSQRIPCPPSLGQLRDGHLASQRSRDGPGDFRF